MESLNVVCENTALQMAKETGIELFFNTATSLLTITLSISCLQGFTGNLVENLKERIYQQTLSM